MSRQALLSESAVKKRGTGNGEHVFWGSNLHDEIPIYVQPTGWASETPCTSHDYLLQGVNENPYKKALGVKRRGKWVWQTYQQYYEACRTFARSLVSLGLATRSCINIIGFNAPEWLISYMGASFADCVPVGIYTTNGIEACQYIEEHSEAQLVVCQNELHLQKYLSYWTPSSRVKAFVIYEPGQELDTITRGKPIYTWDQFMELGDLRYDEEINRRIVHQSPASCSTLVYTSGTTGPPKGVMLTHDNMIWNVKVLVGMGKDQLVDTERLVSYLPLSHSAAQMVDIYQSLALRATVYFAEETAMQGTLVETLKYAQPTMFLGVPRVYEKMEEALKNVAASKGDLLRRISTWAKGIGFQASLRQAQKEAPPFCYKIAHPVVLNNIKKAVGLNACKLFIVSAAPMPRSTLEYLLSLNWLVFNFYGMSECAGPATANLWGYSNLFSGGKAMPGVEMRIMDKRGQEVKQGERGEITWRGRNNFMGYYKQPEESMKTIDENGFLHSGDEGYVDQDGFLFLTGRFKEIIITAGGENVAPVPIEQAIKDRCVLISNAFIVGEGKKFLSGLITLKCIMSPNLDPTDELPDASKRILAEIESGATTVSEALKCPKVKSLVDNAIRDYNVNDAISHAQYVQKWVFLPGDFTQAGGEMTPTMKIKRKNVVEKYAAYIEPFYEEPKL